MPTTTFDELRATLQKQGPGAAIDQLCQKLEADKDYVGLFYALLMQKRQELGVDPVPTGSNQDLPPDAHAAFEETIRDAGRKVGGLFLNDNNLMGAWSYYRMLGEPGPVVEALEKIDIKEHEDAQTLIDIAFQQGAHPKKGFDWILDRYGICSAITSLGGGEIPFAPDVRDHCVRTLIRSLHGELLLRLRGEVAQKQGFEPTAKTIRELIEGRDWLFGEDYYHIDLSHLSSVIQMSIQLEPCEELKLARDLCAYGKKLSPRFLYHTDPPFEQQYHDYDKYLAILTGEAVEEGIAHFRAKADESDPREVGTYPAEVLVNLLLRLKRPKDALDVAKKHLAHLGDTRLSCPNLVELCRLTGDYGALAEAAQAQGNGVLFLAGLLGPGKR